MKLKFFCFMWASNPGLDSKLLPKEATGFQYSWRHVNWLYSGLNNYLDCEFKLILITNHNGNSRKNLHKKIDIVDLWSDYEEYGRCYRRLKLLSSKLCEDESYTNVLIDLDITPLENFQSIFRGDEKFYFYKSPDINGKERLNGGFYAFRGLALKHVDDQFSKDPNDIIKKASKIYEGSDQAVLRYLVGDNAPSFNHNHKIILGKELPRFKISPPNNPAIVWAGATNPFSRKMLLKYPFLFFNRLNHAKK